MADLDRTGGMMVVLFIALAAIKFFIKDSDLEIICSLRSPRDFDAR